MPFVKALALAGVALSLVSAAPLAPTLYSDDTPPARFQGEAVAVVMFVNPDRIDALCGKAPPDKGRTAACTRVIKKGALIIMPRPCGIDDVDVYAHLFCHELGHVLGWPATHGS